MNKVVEQLQQFRMEGNIIPHIWYQSLQLAQKNGKPNLVAITLLADVLYWYRPAEIRDEASGAHLGYRQKFSADKLQKSYRKWGDGFGFTLRQVEDAMAFLKTAGFLTVERRKVVTELGTFPNCAFIEPIFEAIRDLTYPPQEKSNSKRIAPSSSSKTSPVAAGDTSRSNGRRSPVLGESPSRSNAPHGTPKGEHTKTPSETSLKTSSGEAAAACPEVFASLFEESEKNGSERPAAQGWADLPEAARAPWLDQARGELVAIHAGSGVSVRPKLVEVRARNLFETASYTSTQ